MPHTDPQNPKCPSKPEDARIFPAKAADPQADSASLFEMIQRQNEKIEELRKKLLSLYQLVDNLLERMADTSK